MGAPGWATRPGRGMGPLMLMMHASLFQALPRMRGEMTGVAQRPGTKPEVPRQSPGAADTKRGAFCGTRRGKTHFVVPDAKGFPVPPTAGSADYKVVSGVRTCSQI